MNFLNCQSGGCVANIGTDFSQISSKIS